MFALAFLELVMSTTGSCIFQLFILDDVQEKPFQVPAVRPDPEKPNPKLGVGTVLFSFDSRYMATKNGVYLVFKRTRFFCGVF